MHGFLVFAYRITMRAPLVCLIFLICILAIEAKSRWKKGKKYNKNEIYWSINSK